VAGAGRGAGRRVLVFTVVLFVVLAIAGATATGVGAERRYGARAGAAARRILRVMLYALLPPVIFLNIAHLQLTGDAGAGVGLGIVALVLTGAIAYLVSRRALGLSRATTGSVVNASIHGNTSYLGFPVVAAVLGPEHLGEAILYDTLVQGPVFFLGCFGVATALGTAAGGSVGERVKAFLLRNPPLYAVLAGLVAPAALAPEVLVDASRVLVYALLPLGFLAIGMTLADERRSAVPAGRERFTRAAGLAVAMRLVVAPLLLLAIAAPFIDVPAAYLILAATPVGLSSVVLAHEFGLHLRLSAAAIACTTVVALPVAVGVTMV
jgi:malate permease and related proteins